jgi:carbon-monoxide dehydrogenase medium subunit
MIPANFEYHRPATLAEALTLLSTHADDAKLLAGGHSLVPVMKFRLAQPKHLVDISRIRDLRYIREDGNVIAIGAMATHHDIEASDLLKSKLPLLPEAAKVIGDVQVRNKGTLGGSLAHADPAADWPASILALDAQLKVNGSNGSRIIGATDFFVGMMATALQPNELLTEIRIAALEKETGTAYEKFAQKASGFAIAGVAAVITADAKGNCSRARIGVTGVTAKPFRATAVERALEGKPLDSRTIADAVAHTTEGQDPLGDIHASAEFRAHLAKVNAKRAIERAWKRREK